jgi:hypothetical protein
MYIYIYIYIYIFQVSGTRYLVPGTWYQSVHQYLYPDLYLHLYHELSFTFTFAFTFTFTFTINITYTFAFAFASTFTCTSTFAFTFTFTCSFAFACTRIDLFLLATCQSPVPKKPQKVNHLPLLKSSKICLGGTILAQFGVLEPVRGALGPVLGRGPRKPQKNIILGVRIGYQFGTYFDDFDMLL